MRKLLFIILFSLVALPVSAKMLWEYGDFATRAQLATDSGIVANESEYRGTYEQNVNLLKVLEDQKLGANPFQPSGVSVNIRQNLAAGSSRSGTTLNIDPIVLLDSHRLAFSDLNSTTGFGKIDQGTDNEEIISFTGITDNTTYYTLTGVDWGYDFYRTATSTANRKRHTSGASFIITNDWHFVDANYLALNSAQTVTGVKTFTASPIVPTPTTDYQASTKKYIDDTVIAGGVPALNNTAGISKISTGAQAAASTSGDGTYSYVMPSSIATSSPYTTGNFVPVTGSNGKLSDSFTDFTLNKTFSGNTTFATSTIATTTVASLTTSDNATSTLSRIDTDYIGNGATTTVYNNLRVNGNIDVVGNDYRGIKWEYLSSATITTASTTIATGAKAAIVNLDLIDTDPAVDCYFREQIFLTESGNNTLNYYHINGLAYQNPNTIGGGAQTAQTCGFVSLVEWKNGNININDGGYVNTWGGTVYYYR